MWLMAAHVVTDNASIDQRCFNENLPQTSIVTCGDIGTGQLNYCPSIDIGQQFVEAPLRQHTEKDIHHAQSDT